MKIDTEVMRRCLIVRLDGELDLHTAAQFRFVVESEIENNLAENLILNFKGVTFVDSSGLGAILGRYKKITQMGGRMFVTDLRPQVERIFTLSGLLKIIKAVPTETEAIKMC